MSYFIRLADVCLAAYFLITVAMELAAVGMASAAVRRADRMRPAAGARLLLGLRLAPLALSAIAVAAFCVPSYVRFEQDASESVGLICSALAVCGLMMLGASALRVIWSVAVSARLLQVKTGGAAFALVGFLRPRVIVSQGIREALSGAQMEVAMLHEAAHLHAQDNLKRLAMFAAPRALPQRLWRSLEAHWSRLTEWAADDAAIAGEPRRALALAEALVCVARLAGQRKEYSFVSSLVTGSDDLEQRVGRMLAQPMPALAMSARSNARLAAAMLGLGASLVVVIAQKTYLLYLVHCAMERLVH
jgi:hypothetical protein